MIKVGSKLFVPLDFHLPMAIIDCFWISLGFNVLCVRVGIKPAIYLVRRDAVMDFTLNCPFAGIYLIEAAIIMLAANQIRWSYPFTDFELYIELYIYLNKLKS